MDFIKEKNRIYYEDETGNMLAEISFSDLDDQTVEANHTFVDPSLRGQGIAEKLVDAMVEEMKGQNKKIKPTCSYVVKLFQLKKEKYGFIIAN